MHPSRIVFPQFPSLLSRERDLGSVARPRRPFFGSFPNPVAIQGPSTY